MLLRLRYVIVYCSDMKRSVAFYRDQLGFPVRLETPEWSEFHLGPVLLALHIAQPGETNRSGPREAHAGEAHLSFEVLDLETFYQEKKALGVEFSMTPAMQSFGQKLAIFADPDGLPISVTEEIR